MADSTENTVDLARLSAFSSDVKRFETILQRLVVSSFFFSAVAALAQVHQLADNPAAAAMTIMLGTAAGIAGAYSVFLQWAYRPSEETERMFRFRASDHTGSILTNFLVSLFFIFLFYVGAKQSSDWALPALIPGSFLFFRGLATGALVARTIDAQDRLWAGLSPDGRAKWRELEVDELERKVEASELRRKAERLSQETRASMRQWRRQRKLKMLHQWLVSIYHATVSLRRAVGGESLLTSSERARLILDATRAAKALEGLEASVHRDVYQSIATGELKPLEVEGHDLQLYSRGVWHYVRFRGRFDREAADSLAAVVERAIGTGEGRLRHFVVFLDSDVEITTGGRKAAYDRGIVAVRVESWEQL